eukprot:gene1244-1407_t
MNNFALHGQAAELSLRKRADRWAVIDPRDQLVFTFLAPWTNSAQVEVTKREARRERRAVRERLEKAEQAKIAAETAENELFHKLAKKEATEKERSRPPPHLRHTVEFTPATSFRSSHGGAARMDSDEVDPKRRSQSIISDSDYNKHFTITP